MKITARYAGVCTLCGGPIQAGERIWWQKKGDVLHLKCTPDTAQVGPDEFHIQPDDPIARLHRENDARRKA